MLKEYGYLRVGASVNNIEVGNVDINVNEILSCLDNAQKKGIEIICFPELSLTGYTCGDLFFSEDLIKQSLRGIERLKKESNKYSLVFIVGAPLIIDNALYDCAITIYKGKILGINAKKTISYNEARYFTSGDNLIANTIKIDDEEVNISKDIIYKCNKFDFINFSVSIGSELDNINNANLVFNLDSSNEIVSRYEYRKSLIEVEAKKNNAAYVYASSGVNESSSEMCFSGHLMICEPDGNCKENKRFSFDSDIIYTDIDLLRVNHDRIKNNKLSNCANQVCFDLALLNNNLLKEYSKSPFVSTNNNRLEEILNIQTYALARRVKQLNNSKMIIGISGGSDSTLAFLICLRVVKVLNMDTKDIIGVTLPGFGTSERTYKNAINLVKDSGATLKEISIVEACKQHYKDIEHDINNFDVTYENAQARERTQILFDLANKENGIVIGTGDLSELVLGWATYNGDHMSNYGVNAGVPKTLVLSLINKVKDESEGKLKIILQDILNTPISPELLPLDDKGNIVQDSQKSIGPYKLHDFFIYHFLRYGASVKKIYYLACLTFKDEYKKEEIKATLSIFIKRFFTQQFKRNCVPDGVKIGSVSLSPRYDLKLNSDLSYKGYLKEIEDL